MMISFVNIFINRVQNRFGDGSYTDSRGGALVPAYIHVLYCNFFLSYSSACSDCSSVEAASAIEGGRTLHALSAGTSVEDYLRDGLRGDDDGAAAVCRWRPSAAKKMGGTTGSQS
jgi:hypothetical protein